MADLALPAFDPRSRCAKCGWEIPEPEQPQKAGPDGKMMPTGPKPAPSPPTCCWCSGQDCPWAGPEEEFFEHMHQFCDVCGYEWLSQPVS